VALQPASWALLLGRKVMGSPGLSGEEWAAQKAGFGSQRWKQLIL